MNGVGIEISAINKNAEPNNEIYSRYVNLYNKIDRLLFDTGSVRFKNTDEIIKDNYCPNDNKNKCLIDILAERMQQLLEKIEIIQDNNQNRGNTEKKSINNDIHEIRGLLIKAGFKVEATGSWDSELEEVFMQAIISYAIAINNREAQDKIRQGNKRWEDIALILRFPPNIDGAKSMLFELIRIDSYQSQAQVMTDEPTTAPTPNPDATDLATKAKSKLKELFDAILAGSTKVDKVGIDLRRDTMIFKGVIRGLGGSVDAVNYVFSKIDFSENQLNEISNMNLGSNQKITVSALALVRDLFINIRKESTKGWGKDRRGTNVESLERSVARWKAEQSQSVTPAQPTTEAKTQASILRAIEIRKMAARKKLGI
jgi:hypothetical protein